MAMFNLPRRAAEEPIDVGPPAIPQPSVYGWILDGTPLAGRFPSATEHELANLLHCVHMQVDTIYTYERAAGILEREGEYEQALAVCEAWFASPAGQTGVAASRSRALDRRRQRLRAVLRGTRKRS